MMRRNKGINGIYFFHVFLILLCQWASASPVETRCVLRSRYEKLWQPVNDLANKIVSILFKAATFAFHWIPGLQATYMRPELDSPAVGASACDAPKVAAPIAKPPVVAAPAIVANPPPAGYCYIKSPVPVDKAYFKYDYRH